MNFFNELNHITRAHCAAQGLPTKAYELAQSEQMERIVRRWFQANRKQDLLDWHAQTGMLINMAGNAKRSAVTDADREFASDLYTLADLSYERSLEFMPMDFSDMPHLMCEMA